MGQVHQRWVAGDIPESGGDLAGWQDLVLDRDDKSRVQDLGWNQLSNPTVWHHYLLMIVK